MMENKKIALEEDFDVNEFLTENKDKIMEAYNKFTVVCRIKRISDEDIQEWQGRY